MKSPPWHIKLGICRTHGQGGGASEQQARNHEQAQANAPNPPARVALNLYARPHNHAVHTSRPPCNPPRGGSGCPCSPCRAWWTPTAGESSRPSWARLQGCRQRARKGRQAHVPVGRRAGPRADAAATGSSVGRCPNSPPSCMNTAYLMHDASAPWERTVGLELHHDAAQGRGVAIAAGVGTGSSLSSSKGGSSWCERAAACAPAKRWGGRLSLQPLSDAGAVQQQQAVRPRSSPAQLDVKEHQRVLLRGAWRVAVVCYAVSSLDGRRTPHAQTGARHTHRSTHTAGPRRALKEAALQASPATDV